MDRVLDHHHTYNVKQKVVAVVGRSLEGGLQLEDLHGIRMQEDLQIPRCIDNICTIMILLEENRTYFITRE